MSRIAHIPVRWSWLSRIESSPAHALWHAEHGSDPTPVMKMGSAGHAATFEPHRLRVYTGGTLIDEKGKAKTYSDTRQGKCWEAFKAAQPADAVIVNARELEIANQIAAALRRADEERRDVDGRPLPLLFGPGVLRERNIRWTRNGRACSSTPDARLPGSWVADLKIARSGKPDRYVRSATWSGYPAQLAFYQEADAYETGEDIDGIRLFSVVAEPFPPYVVTTYELDAHAIDLGRRKIAEWWNRLIDCEATDTWPGYSSSVVTFTADDPDDVMGPLGGFEPDEPVSVADDTDRDHIDWSAA